jgi:hypothetical protein
MADPIKPAGEWQGHHVGSRRVEWTERDVILFALAVGVSPERTEMVYEKGLRTLPSFVLTLGQWALDALGDAGAFDPRRALHGAQRLEVHAPVPTAGSTEISARVAQVWDKGSAAVLEVEVGSDLFTATWSIFSPGGGGFGGERGPSRPAPVEAPPVWSRTFTPAANAAALYRLLGDRHAIHIDPAAAAAIGQPAPILHGLATLTAATVVAADAQGAHPCDLSYLEGRFGSAVLPGEELVVHGHEGGAFDVLSPRGLAIEAGRARFELGSARS